MWSTSLSRVYKKVKRSPSDSSNSSVLPQPLSLPRTENFDGNDGLWSTFALRIGQPPQGLSFLPSTPSTVTWGIDASTGCPSGIPVPPPFAGDPQCTDSRGNPFNSNRSITWIPNSIYTLGVGGILGFDTTATFGFDDISIEVSGASASTIPHQVVAKVGDPRYWLASFGLYPAATNFSATEGSQPSAMQTMKSNNLIPSLSYGYTAGAYYSEYFTDPFFS